MRTARALALILLAVLLPASAASAELRIVGGSSTAITQTPWQVALLWAGVSNTYTAQFCGGTIRDATTIITAAHCVDDYPASSIDVLAGTAQLGNGSGQRIRAAATSVEPGYNPASNSSDAALIKLSSPITLGAGAAPIPLISGPAAQSLDSPSDDLSVSGWGTTTAYDPGQPANGVRAATLQSVTVPFVPDSTCAQSYWTLVPATMLCAGAAGKDSCQGDSGGPLVYAFGGTLQLAGIVSGGAGCGSANYPGIYTEIAASSVRSFITGAAPAPQPTATAAAAPPPPAATATDARAPTISLLRRLCARTTCNLSLRIADPTPGSGVARVTATMRSRLARCSTRSARRTSACAAARRRTLKARAGGQDLYTIAITRLRPGRHVVNVAASDRGGHVTSRQIAFRVSARRARSFSTGG